MLLTKVDAKLATKLEARLEAKVGAKLNILDIFNILDVFNILVLVLVTGTGGPGLMSWGYSRRG